jgi:hypothetical protein
LYLQQLKDRLGEQAIENISVPAQRTEEPIWELLSSWAGNGSIKLSIPGNATNPSPKNSSTNVTKTPTLSWTSGIDATSHNIYFGTMNPPQFIQNQTDTNFNPGEIEKNLIYYWRIDEKNNIGITKGKVWSFSYQTNLFTDTIYVIADSYVHGEENVNNNFGTEARLIVKSNNLEKYIRETFLKFDLSSIDSQVTEATLSLKVSKDVSDVTHKVNFVSDDSWTENKITYNTKPSIGITIDTKLVPPIDEWIKFSVTSQVQTEIQNDKTISFVISESSLNHYASYYSKESSQDLSPKLIITYGKSVSVKKKENTLPLSFSLNQNYPNPFNPVTTIRYTIHVGTRHDLFLQHIQLNVYDILGSKVATLLNKKQKVGNYEVTFNAENLPSGIYYCRLKSRSFSKTIKMLLIK